MKRGFSMIELLLAAFFMSCALLGLIWMNASSNRSSMDAFYKFQAVQLALEPIEIFRSFGYEWLSDYAGHELPQYPVGRLADITDPTFGGIQHPIECSLFQREITLTPVAAGTMRGIKIKVRVVPRNQSRARTFLLRNDIVMESLVMERPK